MLCTSPATHARQLDIGDTIELVAPVPRALAEAPRVVRTGVCVCVCTCLPMRPLSAGAHASALPLWSWPANYPSIGPRDTTRARYGFAVLTELLRRTSHSFGGLAPEAHNAPLMATRRYRADQQLTHWLNPGVAMATAMNPGSMLIIPPPLPAETKKNTPPVAAEGTQTRPRRGQLGKT